MVINKLTAIFGEDPVSDYSDRHFTIVVDDKKKGSALRALLPESRNPGAGLLKISVRNSGGVEHTPCAVTTIDQLVDVLRAAFAGNSRFVEAREVSGPNPLVPSAIKYAGLVMTNKLVQFYSDDLSEVYCNFNGVTAHVTSELIHTSFQDDRLLIKMGTQPFSGTQSVGKQ